MASLIKVRLRRSLSKCTAPQLGTLNGLGLKQSFVVALGEDIRASVLATFEVDWQRAGPL